MRQSNSKTKHEMQYTQELCCCMFPSGYFPGVWILYADVLEHSACSIFVSR